MDAASFSLMASTDCFTASTRSIKQGAMKAKNLQIMFERSGTSWLAWPTLSRAVICRRQSLTKIKLQRGAALRPREDLWGAKGLPPLLSYLPLLPAHPP
jgi:hypothetical protein